MKNEAAHLAVGVALDGKKKEVVGIWGEHIEGAKFWLRVMNDLKARGIEDVLIVVCGGLTGLPAAIEAVWPDAIVQTCIVHLSSPFRGHSYVRHGERFAGSFRESRRTAAAYATSLYSLLQTTAAKVKG